MMELASMGGNLLLNVSPMGDGSIPENQQRVLLAFGRWMQAHGDGLYGARPWIRMGEGPSLPPEPPGDWKGGSTAVDGPRLSRARTVPPGEADFRFTTGKGALFAFGYKYPAAESRIVSLAQGKASVQRVALAAAGSAPLKFRQTPEALFVTLPPNPDPESRMPYALRIEGSLNFGADA
jgi:alpha-L-fucosidase